MHYISKLTHTCIIHYNQVHMYPNVYHICPKYLSICIQMPFQFLRLSIFKKNQYGTLNQKYISIEDKTGGGCFFLVEHRDLHNVLIIVHVRIAWVIIILLSCTLLVFWLLTLVIDGISFGVSLKYRL